MGETAPATPKTSTRNWQPNSSATDSLTRASVTSVPAQTPPQLIVRHCQVQHVTGNVLSNSNVLLSAAEVTP
jgi:hypothetical protein